jgi:hypothetical protein
MIETNIDLFKAALVIDDRVAMTDIINTFFDIQWGMIHSCFWSVMETQNEDTYDALTTDLGILYNIMFNLGYMVNDVIILVTMAPTVADYWYKFGRAIGDFVLRIFNRPATNRRTYHDV